MSEGQIIALVETLLTGTRLSFTLVSNIRNISSMRRSVSSPDQTPRRELKIRRAAEYF